MQLIIKSWNISNIPKAFFHTKCDFSRCWQRYLPFMQTHEFWKQNMHPERNCVYRKLRLILYENQGWKNEKKRFFFHSLYLNCKLTSIKYYIFKPRGFTLSRYRRCMQIDTNLLNYIVLVLFMQKSVDIFGIFNIVSSAFPTFKKWWFIAYVPIAYWSFL